MIERVTNIQPIRDNLRYATFSGSLNGEQVFIKKAVDPELKAGIQHEASGISAMHKLDPAEAHYRVPQTLWLSDDTIITTWADGGLMADMLKAEPHHYTETLLDLFLFIDGASEDTQSVTRFNRPGQENNIDATMRQLEGLAINFSAAMRSIQIMREILGGNTHPGKEELPEHLRQYLSTCMKHILQGELFTAGLLPRYIL